MSTSGVERPDPDRPLEWTEDIGDELPPDACASEILAELWAGGAVAARRFAPDQVGTVGLVSNSGPPERYLDADQAAEYLNVSPRYIRRLVEERSVAVTKIGKFVRFRREDLDAVAERIERSSSPGGHLRAVLSPDDPFSRLLDGSMSHPSARKRS